MELEQLAAPAVAEIVGRSAQHRVLAPAAGPPALRAGRGSTSRRPRAGGVAMTDLSPDSRDLLAAAPRRADARPGGPRARPAPPGRCDRDRGGRWGRGSPGRERWQGRRPRAGGRRGGRDRRGRGAALDPAGDEPARRRRPSRPPCPRPAPPAVAPVRRDRAPRSPRRRPRPPRSPRRPRSTSPTSSSSRRAPRPPRPASASASSPSAAPLPPAADLPADPPTTSPPVAVDPLTRELAHLRAARTALRAGDPGAAEAALTSYRAEFAAGQLAEEAGALAVEVRCAAGDPAGAERARATFLRRWPTSTARARVLGLCPGR
jgi:hypothetical protein